MKSAHLLCVFALHGVAVYGAASANQKPSPYDSSSSYSTLPAPVQPLSPRSMRLPTLRSLSPRHGTSPKLPVDERQHIPIVLCIDEDNIELKSPRGGRYFVTFLHNLTQRPFKPCIVASKSILQAFLEEYKENFDKHNLFPGYTLYDIPDTTYFALLSPEFNGTKSFAWSNLRRISDQHHSPAELQQWLEEYETSKTRGTAKADDFRSATSPKNILEKFFDLQAAAADQSTVWDFWIGGHGASTAVHGAHQETVANLPVKKFAHLLSFFNTHVPVGTVFAQTCYGGGNLKNITRALPGHERLTYPFIMGSFSDSIVSMDRGEEGLRILENYFKSAALGNKGADLNRTLNTLLDLRNSAWFGTHGSENICQVLLPHHDEFRVLRHKEDPHTALITPVRLRSNDPHACDFSNQTRALIFTTPKITRPLSIRPFKSPRKDDPESICQRLSQALDKDVTLPHLTRSLTQHAQSGFDNADKMAQFSAVPIRLLQLAKIPNIPRETCSIMTTGQEVDPETFPHLAQLTTTPDLKAKAARACSYYYPEFLTANIEPDEMGKRHITITKPVTLKRATPLNGLYSFFINSFIATEPTHSTAFHLASLTGPDDIPLLIELLLLHNPSKKAELTNFEYIWNKELAARFEPETQERQLTLTNITIEQKPNNLCINFSLDGENPAECMLAFYALPNGSWYPGVFYIRPTPLLQLESRLNSLFNAGAHFENVIKDFTSRYQLFEPYIQQMLAVTDDAADQGALIRTIEQMLASENDIVQNAGAELLGVCLDRAPKTYISVTQSTIAARLHNEDPNVENFTIALLQKGIRKKPAAFLDMACEKLIQRVGTADTPEMLTHLLDLSGAISATGQRPPTLSPRMIAELGQSPILSVTRFLEPRVCDIALRLQRGVSTHPLKLRIALITDSADTVHEYLQTESVDLSDILLYLQTYAKNLATAGTKISSARHTHATALIKALFERLDLSAEQRNMLFSITDQAVLHEHLGAASQLSHGLLTYLKASSYPCVVQYRAHAHTVPGLAGLFAAESSVAHTPGD